MPEPISEEETKPSTEPSTEPSGKPANKPALWRRVLPWLFVIVATPLTLAIGAKMGSRTYVITSILIIIYAMIPFFVSFERRKPQARELVTLAVLIAIAVAARALFAFVPQFKPMAGLIMIAGIAFGGSSGFLVGTLAALVSNFFFGQGPWTSWQMLAFGLCGFVFGFLADRGVIKRGGWSWKTRVVVSLCGGLFIVIIAGPILDTSSLFWMASFITPETALAIYGSGFPMNVVHGIATLVTVLLVGNPMLDKLARLKTKYGMMQ